MDAEEGESSDIVGTTGFQNARVFGGAGIYDIITTLIFILFALFTLFSNVFVMIVLHRARNRFEDVMRSLIQALAITDLVGGVICCVLQTLYTMLRSFPFARNICEGLPVNALYLILTSLFLLCLINIYRCVTVINPLFSRRHVTVRRIRVTVVLVNVVVLCFVVPIIPIRYNGILDYACMDSSAETIHVTAVNAVTIAALVLSLFIITATNAKLLLVARKRARRSVKFKTSSNPPQSRATEPGERCHQDNALNVRQSTRRRLGLKGLKTILAVTIMLYISCIPFCITVAFSMRASNKIESIGVSLAFILLLGNCWWNALIFLFISKTFREEAIKVKDAFRERLNIR